MTNKNYCYMCGETTLDICTCDRCGKEVCPNCYDDDNELCIKCVQEQ